MRWIPFIVLLYVVLVVQTTVGAMLTFANGTIGTIGPDLMALVAVFLALHARGGTEAALGAWAAGLAVDLTMAGGVGAATVVGPMPFAYTLAAAGVYKIREAFFRERELPQALLALIFCLGAHGMWVTLQALLGGGSVTWPVYGKRLAQAAALAVYTAALMPLGHWVLTPLRGWILVATAERHRRARR